MEEADYLFRHAALRDAAYHLQIPSERARMHKLVFEILEGALSEPERELLALPLAEHAELAQRGVTWATDALPRKSLEYLQLAARNAASRFENQQAIQLYDRIAAHPMTTIGQRVDAIVECGTILWFVGRRQAAIRKLDEAVECASSDMPRLAFALIERGALYRDLNHYDRARRDLQLALEVARDCKDRRLELRAHGNLGTVLQRGRTGAQVEELFAPVLALASELGNDRAIGITKGQIAQGYNDDGDHARAEALLRESLNLLRKCGDRMNEAVMLSTLGASFLSRTDGDLRGTRQKAATYYREAIRVNESIGNRPQQPEALAGLARACLELGLESEAERSARTAIAEGIELGKPGAVASALQVIGRICEHNADIAGAETNWRQGLQLALDHGIMDTARSLRQRLSALLRKTGRVKEAELIESA